MIRQTGPRPINNQFAIVESHLLGKGSTGNVYLGFERGQPHHKVAIKVINLQQIDNEVTHYLLNCEVAALSNLGKRQNTAHDNIVRLFDAIRQDHFIYLVTEILQGGTLANYIKWHPNGLTEDQAFYIFRQIVEGYRHMRLRNVVHRDLKPDNILFRTNPEHSKRIAIIDFGYCEMAQIPNKPQVYYNVGSPKYMSPQAYQDNRYSQKSDVWALGVILYELLLGKTCDVGMDIEAYLQMVKNSGIPLPAHLSPFARHLLSSVLVYSQQARYDCHQILKELDIYQNSHHPHNLDKRNEFINTELKQEFKAAQKTLNTPRSNVVFQSMVRKVQHLQNINNQPISHLNPIQNQFSNIVERQNQNNLQDKQLNKSNTVVNIPIPMIYQTQTPNGNQILGRVDNVNCGSARQIVHRKNTINISNEGLQKMQNSQHQSQTPYSSYNLQKNRQVIHTRHLSINQPKNPLTPQPRQSVTFSMINAISNDPQYSLRNTMPTPTPSSLQLGRAPRAITTISQPDENNQMSPYPYRPALTQKPGVFFSQKPNNTATKKVQFYTQKRLFPNQMQQTMMLRSSLIHPPINQLRLPNYPQQNMSMPNIPPVRLFRHA